MSVFIPTPWNVADLGIPFPEVEQENAHAPALSQLEQKLLEALPQSQHAHIESITTTPKGIWIRFKESASAKMRAAVTQAIFIL